MMAADASAFDITTAMAGFLGKDIFLYPEGESRAKGT